VTVLPAAELLPPGPGRRFAVSRTVRLGDVDPIGELRFDAIGRYLQDVASDDARDAGLPNALGWVVRRTLIRVTDPAVEGETVELTTYCTGAGRSWAERRTTLRSDRGAMIDAVSLWVQLDVATGRPARLGAEFDTVYGAAAAGRQVSSKLSLPGRPPESAPGRSWSFRRSDLDQFGHVNNAAQLALVEEGRPARRSTVEIEYLTPADAGVEYLAVSAGPLTWLTDAGGGVVTVFAVDRPGQAQPSSSAIGVS
jgi:acyl-ACP thioesterase